MSFLEGLGLRLGALGCSGHPLVSLLACGSGRVLSYSGLLWAALYCNLLSIHSPGFAKKTFISYSVTFKENFRQGLVVEIDLKNQTVLLEDGQVSPAGADHSQLTSGGPWDAVAGGRIPGLVSSGTRHPHPCPVPGR